MKERTVRLLRTLTVLMLVALAAFVLRTAKAGDDFDDAMRRAGEAVDECDYQRARELYLAALPLAETPDQRFTIHLATGAVLQLQHREPEAREALRAALAVDGVSPDTRFKAYLLIALTWEAEETPAAVRATYAQALQEKLSPPVRCVALARLAAAWHEEGQLETAKDTYAEVLKLAETEGDSQQVTQAHSAIGDILAEQGSLAEALEAYERALCAHGGWEVFICYNVGRVLIDLKRYSDARLALSVVAESQHALPLTRNDALMLTAKALQAEGRGTEAEQIKERVFNNRNGTEVSPEPTAQSEPAFRANCRAFSFLAIGRFHLDEGKTDMAREAFTRVVEMEDATAEVREKARAQLDAMN